MSLVGFFKLLLVVLATFAGLRLVGWLQFGIKHRIASTMLWAAALACAFVGLLVYAVATDPFMTHSQVPMGWPGTLVTFITLLAFPVAIIHALLSSRSDSDKGKNWRNAGDRDSDPDNQIWVGNPSHDD